MKATIVGMLVATNGITLFQTDGKTIVLAQDGYKTKEIAEAVALPLARDGRAEIEIEEYNLAKAIAKAIPEVALQEKNGATALIDKKTKEVLVSDVKKVEAHLERAVYGKGAKGFKKFLADFKKVPNQITEQELLDFMEANDLPICDDGSFLVYKFLNAGEGDSFHDMHTGKVVQRLGSVVQMPRELANQSKRIECASGLHVCSRKYGSYGNHVFLAKVFPSDVVAVPDRGSKMRVVKYHLVRLLDKHLYDHVLTRTHLSANKEGAKILSEVVAGKHAPIVEVVTVGGSFVENKKTPLQVEKVDNPVASKVGKIRPVEVKVPSQTGNGVVDPKELRDKLREAAASGDYGAAITAAVAKPKVKT